MSPGNDICFPWKLVVELAFWVLVFWVLVFWLLVFWVAVCREGAGRSCRSCPVTRVLVCVEHHFVVRTYVRLCVV